MESIVLKCVNSGATLEFFDREPEDSQSQLDYFSVRITHHNMAASCRVYGYGGLGLGELFENIARRWTGWEGPISWRSLEGELDLSCTHDRRGHILMQVDLRAGDWELGWQIRTGITIEAGQLDEYVRGISRFVGYAVKLGS